MKTEFIAFAIKHPYITAVLLLAGGYGTYRLGGKLLDSVTYTANHAIDARYSVEASKDLLKVGPQLPQAIVPQLPAAQ